MREIKPYKTLQGAKAALDNGGRFFNLYARAGDDRITSDELTKAAGAFLNESLAYLFLDMALKDLPESQRQQVVSMLTPQVAARYRKRGPASISASQAAGKNKPGDLVIIEGSPAYVADVIQKRQTFLFLADGAMIPIWIDEHFQTYDLKDGAGKAGGALPMIMSRRAKRLEKVPARFGGALREFTLEGKPKTKGVYFEPVYFTRLE